MDDFIPAEEIEKETEDQEEVLEKMPKGDKAALIKFDGTLISEEGNVVKHNWFKGIDTDSGAYSNIMLTPTEARQLRTAHQRMRTGASIQSVMTCYGPSICPRAKSCPYVQLQRQLDDEGVDRRVVPINKKCPVEQDLLVHNIKKMAAEFNVGDKENEFTDQRAILELAEIEVLESRINTILATDPELQGLTEEKLVSSLTGKTGEVQENFVKDVADLLKIKEKLWARKDKIRKDLVGTRREKRIISAREGEVAMDASQHMADINKRLKQLINEGG